MADEMAVERTEDATPKRRADARNEGQIPRSQDLTIAASLLGSAVAISALAPAAGRGLLDMMGSSLANIGTVALDESSATALLRQTAAHAFSAVFGLVAAMSVGSFVMAALQGRGVLSLKPITPQFSRINPATNAKKLFGVRSLIELVKSLGKLTIVSAAAYMSIRAVLPDAIALSQESQLGLLVVVQRYAVRMLATVGAAYLALGVGDYVWQWWLHERSLRMTREEVRQEMKQNEGDPQVKQRRRAIARSYGRLAAPQRTEGA